MTTNQKNELNIKSSNRRPTKQPHAGSIKNEKTFEQTFLQISQNPEKIYFTTGKEIQFTAIARMATKGKHRGNKVIVFMQNKKEVSRVYACCWGHQTNCNKTYIDSYTPHM